MNRTSECPTTNKEDPMKANRTSDLIRVPDDDLTALPAVEATDLELVRGGMGSLGGPLTYDPAEGTCHVDNFPHLD
jgi:hypothetical protein